MRSFTGLNFPTSHLAASLSWGIADCCAQDMCDLSQLSPRGAGQWARSINKQTHCVFSASLCTSWAGRRQPAVFSRTVSPNTPSTSIHPSPQLARSLPGGQDVTTTGKPSGLPWDTQLFSGLAAVADSVRDGTYSLTPWRALPECDTELATLSAEPRPERHR